MSSTQDMGLTQKARIANPRQRRNGQNGNNRERHKLRFAKLASAGVMKSFSIKKIILRIVIPFTATIVLFLSICNKTSHKIARYITFNCDFKDTAVFFNYYDSTYYTAPAGFIDLKKALNVDYDTLYLISCGFESDISDIIGFQYNGGDFTLESEDKDLLLLVKNRNVVYESKLKSLLNVASFVYPSWEDIETPYLLKHSSSIYKVERERDGLMYRYYLFNVEGKAK